MSKTYCALPWQHMCVGPEGTVRLCCVTIEKVTKDGVPMSLYRHSPEEIFNSAYMREVRRAMLAGEPLKECEVCYRNEAATGQSYRKSTGLRPLRSAHLDPAALHRAGEASGYRVDQRPGFIKLEVGNLCNLKCRMCYGAASSQIERDPVHNRWNESVDPVHAVWREGTALIGPHPMIGVHCAGFYDEERYDGTWCRWTSDRARVEAPVSDLTQVEAVEIRFHPSGARGQALRIFVNDQLAFAGGLDRASLWLELSAVHGATGDIVRIEIESDVFLRPGDSNPVGVPVTAILLHRRRDPASDDGHPELLWRRFGTTGPWYDNDELLFDELLGDVEGLERLNITGGEPLINQRVEEIVNYLVFTGASRHIDIEFVTNCTHLPPRLLDSLTAFRRVSLYLSLDGIGADYEYIRYPARWAAIEQNVRLLKDMGRFYLAAIPVVQIYNALNLHLLCRFCDELEIDFSLESLLQLPRRLAVDVMPVRARQAAAARLREYAEGGCRPQFRQHVMTLASQLYSMDQRPDPALVREFMLFTNDLDATRHQSFKDTYPELYSWMVEDGFAWTPDKRFADGAVRTVPAKDRRYAWL